MDLAKLKELKDLLDNEIITKEEFELMKKSLISDLIKPNNDLNTESERIINSEKELIESVKIGEQEWAIKNLNVTHFNNGDPILEAETIEKWKKACSEGSPAWCYYDNDQENGNEFGTLYNYHVIIDPRGIAPCNFRIPTADEFKQLIGFLGEDEELWKKLKSRSGWEQIEIWEDCELISAINGNGTNKSGFNAMPGGTRQSSSSENPGIFAWKGKGTSFWTNSIGTGIFGSSKSPEVSAGFQFNIFDKDCWLNCAPFDAGISIRLIKNN